MPESGPLVEYCPFCNNVVKRTWLKACKACWMPFRTDKRNQEYCSEDCRTLARKFRKPFILKEYGKECEVCRTPYVSKRYNAKYCGHACRVKAYRIRKIMEDR